MPSNCLILCCLLLLPPSIIPSIRVFSNESVLRIRWPKYWSLSFSISPSNKYSGLISFRMDWLDLLAVQGTLESSPTPQSQSINSSVIREHQAELPVLYTAPSHWLYVLYMVVHIWLMLSPFVPPSSPHPPQVHSIHLCLYSCSAYRFISTIFLDFVYTC